MNTDQNSFETQPESDEFELTDEFKAFIDEGIASLERGESTSHESFMKEMQAKYPQLDFHIDTELK